ncbi:MAG TPA: tetratricopeptide repeat protein [Afifellaceae bacterium]|nr:tetratricopeptide repeat protein [Afifellaceae bacterium]
MCGVSLVCPTAPGLAQDHGITYEQVLASPDDLSLSYAFARQAAEAGRLEQAAGALERILLIEPDFDAARLFYAIVLYRLDDMEGAARELRLLQSRALTPEQQSEVDRYLELSEKRGRDTRITASTSVGFGYDGNPTLNSRSDAGFSAGFDVPLERSKEESASGIAAGDLRIEQELGTGRGDFLFLETRGWLKEYFEAESADYAIARLEAGGTFYAGDLALTPRGIVSASLLDGDRYVTEAGGGLRLRHAVTSRFALLADILALQQDFAALEDSLTGAVGLPRDGRAGLKVRAAGGFSARLSQRDTLTLQAAYVAKDAEHAAFSYDGLELNLNYLTLLGRGQYIMADAWYWGYDFDAPDPRYSPTLAHEDDRYRVRLSYGVPLDTLIRAFADRPDLPAGLREINLQLSADYYRQDSAIPNLDFHNVSGEVLLTKRFTF